MKRQLSDNEKLLLITAGFGALVWLSSLSRKKMSGVGKVKFYKALSEAQRAGVVFGGSPNSLSAEDEQALKRIGEQNGYKQSKGSSLSGKSYAKAFYGYLNAKYKQVAGIGAIQYPYTEYVVKNDRGDTVIIFRDFDEQADLKSAVDYVDEIGDPQTYAYYATLAYIASGGRFVWKSKKIGGQLISRGLEDELYGSTVSHNEERKKRVQILGSAEKGALYPEQFVHKLWESKGAGDDDYYIKSGVLDALNSIYTRKAAKDELLSFYYSSFAKEDLSEEAPF